MFSWIGILALLFLHDALFSDCVITISSLNAPHTITGLHDDYSTIRKKLIQMRGGMFENAEVESTSLDEQLYSRQILVYGKSGQQSLMSGKVVLFVNYKRGNEGFRLACEITKNLALAGLGRLRIIEEHKHLWKRPERSILFDCNDLSELAKSLNHGVDVAIMSIEDFDLDVRDSNQNKNDVMVCVGYSLEELQRLNDKYRVHGIRFIACQVIGVCGFVFNDFLENFVVEDVNTEPDRTILLNKATPLNGYQVEVSCIAEESLAHIGLNDSVKLKLTTISGNTIELEGNVCAVKDTKSLAIDITYDLDSVEKGFLAGGTIQKLKKKLGISHTSLRKQLKKPNFASCNSCLSEKQDIALNKILLASFMSLNNMDFQGRLDVDSFEIKVVSKLMTLGIRHPKMKIKQNGVDSEVLHSICRRLWQSRRGTCAATVSIIGSLASQETIKALTRVHLPVSQFLFFESLDSLIEENNVEGIKDIANNELSETELVYGAELCQELENLRVFIVGAGAIGCELLKTFALSGIGEAKPYLLKITDMDFIERSNLNRQLLYRREHIGFSKAQTSAEMIQQVNPFLSVESHMQPMGSRSENTFNAMFWKNVDVVATALDNIEARRYCDDQAVLHGKWMLDSGTLGTKGNSQVIIPHVSESYTSSSDPPEESIPVCTLKSFPYSAEHCVAWSKNLFDQLFTIDMQYLQSTTNLTSLDENDAIRIQSLMSFIESIKLETDLKRRFLLATKWSRRLFDKLYKDDIKELIREHPIDEIDEDGEFFWSGSRKFPQVLEFNHSDSTHDAFIHYSSTTLLRCIEILKDNTVKISPESFEKDDESLGHVQFVASASALRCRVYSIEELSGGYLAVQQLAGRIIPAVATTTSIVAGLVTHELIKIAGEKIRMRRQKISESAYLRSNVQHILPRFRNAFVNIARPTLAFAQPVEANSYSSAGNPTSVFTMWDTLEFHSKQKYERDLALETITMEDIQEYLQRRFHSNLRITSLSVEDLLLFADFLSSSDEEKLEQFQKPILQLLLEVNADNSSQQQLIEDLRSRWRDRGFIDIEALIANEDDQEIRIPEIRVRL